MSRFPRKAAPVDLRVIKRPLKQDSKSEEIPPTKRRRVDDDHTTPKPSPPITHKASSTKSSQPKRRGRPPGSKNKKTLIKEQQARLGVKLRQGSTGSPAKPTPRLLRQPNKQLNIIKHIPQGSKSKKKVEKKLKKKRYVSPPSPSPSPSLVEEPILPFGNRLTTKEAETERAVPSQKSKDRYERAKKSAEVRDVPGMEHG
jgi:hypothetical protein